MIHLSLIINERFYLHLLLIKISDSQSFKQLQTVNEQLCATFQEICIANEFLKNDQKWMICFIKMSHWTTEQALQSIFMSVLQYGNIIKSTQLWNQFASDICSDLPHQIEQQMNNVPVNLKNAHWNFNLHLITQNLARYKQILNDFNMPGSVLS